MGWIIGQFSAEPFLALFVTVAAGYLLGKLEWRGLGLGTSGATLLVGLAISLYAASVHRAEIRIDPFVQLLFFNFFMFAVGLRVGPQFFAGLERDGWRFVGVTLATALLAPVLAFSCAALFRLPLGSSAGVLAGGMTASSALGAAQSAIATGSLGKHAGASPEQVGDNLAAAFAITYVLSMTCFVVLVKLLPRWFHRDPVADAHQLDVALRSSAAPPGTDSGFQVGYTPIAHRAFRVENPIWVGLTLDRVETLAPRASVERVRRNGEFLPLDESLRLQAGDEIGVVGHIEGLIRAAGGLVGPELADPELRDVPMDTAELVLRRRELAGMPLEQVSHRLRRGVYLVAWFRAGQQLPLSPQAEVKLGDVLRVTGSAARIKAAEEHLGGAVRYDLSTDILTLALGLVAGSIVGLLAVKIGSVRLALGSAVGMLLSGVGLGTVRSRYPLFGGPVPDPARGLLEDLGLAVFIAALALSAGPGVAQSVKGGTLLPLIVGGLVVGLVPPTVGYAFGLWALKLNPAVLLGAVCGACSNTAGLKVAQQEAHSGTPAVGFAVPTALGTMVVTVAAYLLMVV